MKISLPSITAMHEYLLAMGEDWVKNRYNITGDDIDNLLYGAVIPTQERQKKKIAKAMREDENAALLILTMFERDHFVWDEPNSKHIKCANAVDKEKPIITPDFIKEWIKMYISLMEWDMKMNENCMKCHGWSLGERVINKTTSLTTDDDVHERMIRYLEAGSMLSQAATKCLVVLDGISGKCGHNHEDENFIEHMESNTLSHKSVAISRLQQNTDG